MQNKEYRWGTKFMKIEARRGRLERKYFGISGLRRDVTQEKVKKKDNRKMIYLAFRTIYILNISNIFRK